MKKFLFIFVLLIFALTGCQSATTDGAFFHDYLVNPFSFLIHEIGTFLGGNFGVAIIVITLLIRLVLLPFMLKTYKNQQDMKGKMALIKPEMSAIQKKSKKRRIKKNRKSFSRN